MIKLIEGIAAGNTGKKALAIKVILQNDELLQTEFYQIKDSLLAWNRVHGSNCGGLEIEYQADETIWPQIEQFWIERASMDPLIRSLFENVGHIDLCMMTPEGRNVRTIGFEVGANK